MSSQKHIMLSYQWDHQKLVTQVYRRLKEINIPLWMDTQGGMKGHLSESMADGVENAAAICCFLTPKYQDSAACKDELTYGKEQRVRIIPILVMPDWKPTGWLGFTIAGHKWINFCDIDTNMDLRMEQLVAEIQMLVGDKLNCFQGVKQLNFFHNANKEVEKQNEKFPLSTLLSSTNMTNSISIDPANLAAYGQQIGQTFSFVITGGVNGSIYGTNIYTLDSNLATAAVHAGFLCISETKNVTIKILPGQESYTASTQNGVTSSSYGSWKGSYSFVVAMSPSNVGPSNVADYSDKLAQTFSFVITGDVNGSIYGTNIYTLDSNLATAAVHAGFLRIGETKNITIKILPGQESYTASTQNGVTSSSYGSWKGSYSFISAGGL
ncbi:unnamed protein product [Rotaria sp. Silwood2]|nr:unnamed protein product [Rotaria sp. Silwood2]